MILLGLDCEAVNQYGLWSAIAVVVTTFPYGKVLDQFVVYAHREPSCYDPPRLRFWQQQPDAHKFIEEKAKQDTRTLDRKEISLLRFIRRMHQKYSRLQVVSDNPAFDIKIVDQLAEKHGFPCITTRESGGYTQAVCTYTYQRTVQHMSAYKMNHLWDPWKPFRTYQRPIATLLAAPHGPHTPLYDTYRMLAKHLNCIDVVKFLVEGTVPVQFMVKQNSV